jgi:hypothetical protein
MVVQIDPHIPYPRGWMAPLRLLSHVALVASMSAQGCSFDWDEPFSGTGSGSGGGGAAGGAGGGGTAATARSCKDLLARDPGRASGVYEIDPDGAGGTAPFSAYCEMGDQEGGWTLALKIDGEASTFGYSSELWENTFTLNEAFADLDEQEAKLATFHTVPFTELRVGMTDQGETRWLVFERTAPSLRSLFAGESLTETELGRAAWRSLVASSSLQDNCNREGFNVTPDTSDTQARVRLGIIANGQVSCVSTDSWIGFGGDGSCNLSEVGCGNVACVSADNGDRATRTFGYVFVR